jgi:hypothetical protein
MTTIEPESKLAERVTFCARSGCMTLVKNNGYCPAHTFRHVRPEFDKFYNKRAWRDRVRPMKLRRDPICEFEKDGKKCTDPAAQVHHKDGSWKQTGDWHLFIDNSNLMSLCHSHHSQITMEEQNKERGYRP